MCLSKWIGSRFCSKKIRSTCSPCNNTNTHMPPPRHRGNIPPTAPAAPFPAPRTRMRIGPRSPTLPSAGGSRTGLLSATTVRANREEEKTFWEHRRDLGQDKGAESQNQKTNNLLQARSSRDAWKTWRGAQTPRTAPRRPVDPRSRRPARA